MGLGQFRLMLTGFMIESFHGLPGAFFAFFMHFVVLEELFQSEL